MIKKVISAVLICIFALPFSVCAEYYNSQEIYKNVLPSVRDQGGHSDCWSYAAIGAVSYSMAVNDNADFSKEDALFSEGHMSAAINTAEDRLLEKYTRSHDEGGNRAGAVAYLARSRFSGPVLYKDYCDEEYEMYLSGIGSYRMLNVEKKQATLTKAQFLTERDEGSSYASYDKETKTLLYGKNQEVINKIKNAVRLYGGVAVSYYAYERDQKTYYNPETAAYCVPWEHYVRKKTPDGNCVRFSNDEYRFERATNHAVVIVGWDDNYSYENFKDAPVSFDGENYTYENGAWIVKGSWGESFGDNGYEYISYMEPTIGQFATCYDMEYTQNYSMVTHNEKGLMGSVRFPSVGYGVCAANRFEKEGLINAVGIYVCHENASVQLLIDIAPEEDLKRLTKEQFDKNTLTLIDMETGEETNSLSFETPGYYLLRLKTPVKVSGRFDIYAKYTVSEKSDLVLPSGSNLGTDEAFVPNVSYWAHITGNGHVHKWKGIDTNWCISVFTTDADFEKVKVQKETDSVKLKLYRYNEKAEGTVIAVFYKDGKVTERRCLTPQFDQFGYWETKLETDADHVKAIVWQKNKKMSLGEPS